MVYTCKYKSSIGDILLATDEIGLIGAFTGGLSATAGGIAAAVFFGTLIALAFKPRAK